jgi:hypothetical protein
VNKEITEVESILEEEPTSVKVGFDICGTDPEPELSVDQGKPWVHLNPPYVLKSFISLMLISYCPR